MKPPFDGGGGEDFAGRALAEQLRPVRRGEVFAIGCGR